METKSIIKRRSSMFLSFSLLVLGMLAANPAKADDDDNGGARLVGHYKGFLDLSVIGIPRLEEFQVLLNRGGTAVIVVDEDPDYPGLLVEMESSALGIWKRVGPQMVKVGVIQFRTGELLCSILDGRPDNVCTAQIALEATVDTKGNMTGYALVEVIEFDEETNTTLREPLTPVPLKDVSRTRLDQFIFPSEVTTDSLWTPWMD